MNTIFNVGPDYRDLKDCFDAGLSIQDTAHLLTTHAEDPVVQGLATKIVEGIFAVWNQDPKAEAAPLITAGGLLPPMVTTFKLRSQPDGETDKVENSKLVDGMRKILKAMDQMDLFEARIVISTLYGHIGGLIEAAGATDRFEDCEITASAHDRMTSNTSVH